MFETITLDNVLQGIFIGIIVAVLSVAYNKLIIGKFVKALIKAEAVHPAFAKTFEDLDVKKTFLLSFALRAKGTLRKFVFELDDDGKEGYFYIPEDKLYRADRIYGGKDVDPLMVFAVIIVLLMFFAIVLMYFPVVFNQVSTFTGLFS